MRKCTYCGRLNEDEVTYCVGCGQDEFRPYTEADRLGDERRMYEASRKPETSILTFNLQGIGTTLYGQRDFRADGTYLTTMWLVFFFVPLIPVRSLRVRYQGPGAQGGNYAVVEERFPQWKQVLYTYAYVAFLAGWPYLAGSTAFSFSPDALDTVLGVTLLFIVCIMPVPAPWILRCAATRRLQPRLDGTRRV